MVFGDRFDYIEMCDFVQKTCGPSRQVISYASGLSLQASNPFQDTPHHGFDCGMKLEVVNPTVPGQICCGTVDRVTGPLLWLTIDSVIKGLTNHVVDVESCDIFPVGWADSNGYLLNPPRKTWKKKAPLPVTER